MGYVWDPISWVTERKSKKLRGPEMVEAHWLMVEEYDFDIKIDFEGMEKLLHPYHGYFMAIKDVLYSIDEIYDVYWKLLLATHERNKGMTLLANEITALRLWESVDEERTGVLSFDDMKRLIHGYWINTDGWSMKEFEHEFDTILWDHPHEIIGSNDNPKFRFDFGRRLFLERGL